MQQPYNPYYNPYQAQTAAPMDRLSQLQAQQYQSMAPQAAAQANQGLLWVQGEAAAKSYLVAPNTTVLLLDSEGSRFYLKSTDNAGMPNLRTFEYSEVLPTVPQAQQSAAENLDDKYVTREEYNGLKAQYKDILDKLNNFHAASMDDDAPKRSVARSGSARGKGGNADE